MHKYTDKEQLVKANAVYCVLSNWMGYDTHDYLADQMAHYDEPELYRRDIRRGYLDRLVGEEWEAVWTAGDNVFLTAAEAEREARDARATGGSDVDILEITRDDVELALIKLFGEND